MGFLKTVVEYMRVLIVYYNLLNFVIVTSCCSLCAVHDKTFPTLSTLSGFGSIKIASKLIRTLPLTLPLVNGVPSSDHVAVGGHAGDPLKEQHSEQKGMFSGTEYDDKMPKKVRE